MNNNFEEAINEAHLSLVGELEREEVEFQDLTKEKLNGWLDRLTTDQGANPPNQTLNWGEIRSRVVNRILGFGPLQPLLDDISVTEIMVNGLNSVYVERSGLLTRENIVFSSLDELLLVINRIVSAVGRRIDESSPLVDARLPDGSRVNAIIPPLSRVGPVLTIRRFPSQPLTVEDLTANQTLSQKMAKFLRAAVISKQNILISGSTGSGKTSLLNALAGVVPTGERLITIEDTAEIKLPHPHLVQLEARHPNLEGQGEVSIRILLKNALRMRPDRIIIGEVRGGEALDMLQAMNTGHPGSLTTIHANSPGEALSRLETMALMAGVGLSLEAIRGQIMGAIRYVVQQERLPNGARKLVAICELNQSATYNLSANYFLKPLFTYNKLTNQFICE